MKRYFLLLAATLFVGSTFAQNAPYRDNVLLYDAQPMRRSIILPQVDGFNCYKADLHVHTIFSDGNLSPDERVDEAWQDGLDILAITDHIETRRQERSMLKFLKGYSPDKRGFEPVNTRCSRGVPADERGILSDLNYSTEIAREHAAAKYPELFIIKGTEISREPVNFGHFNALFTKDNNAIYVVDNAQAIRNARAQGAIIIHNHPGWERTTTDKNDFHKQIYAEGLIDGVEITNGIVFYPKIVERCIREKLFMVSATDIHKSTSSLQSRGFFRPMTLIFAKKNDERGIREALLARRTLGYCGGNVIGEISLLEKFFKASVTATLASESKSKKNIVLKNSSSIPYSLSINGRAYSLEALSEISISVKDKISVTVHNMIHVDYQHPTFELDIKR